MVVSTHALLSQLEREPGEFIVDPWVVERVTLVAEQRGRIAAAAHLLRYGGGPQVDPSYREAGEIRWLLWAGFVPGNRTEIVFVADIDGLASPGPPLPDLSVTRTLGPNGTRFTAVLAGAEVGYVEVDIRRGDSGRVAASQGWADIGNLHVAEPHRRKGIARWLVGQAADWLLLGHIARLLDYATTEHDGYLRFLRQIGFRQLTRTTRGWELQRARVTDRDA